MDNFPGMSDPAIVIAVVFALLAGALIIFIFFCLRSAPFDTEIGDKEHYLIDVTNLADQKPIVFEKNQDLRLFHDNRHFLIPRRERSAWLAGIVVTLALTALLSWTSQRDEADRRADRILADPRMERALKAARCMPPDAPLEKLLITIGTQSDGKAPAIICTYVTSPLGTMPQFRHQPARYAKAR